MIVEDTKDLVETDDYVIIEATLSEGDLLFVQIAVGIRNEVGDMFVLFLFPLTQSNETAGQLSARLFLCPFLLFLGCRWGSAVGVCAYIVRGTWVPCDGVFQIICKRAAKSID